MRIGKERKGQQGKRGGARKDIEEKEGKKLGGKKHEKKEK